MMARKIIKFLIFLFIFIIQISLLSASSFLRSHLNLILLVLIYYLYISGAKQGLIDGLIFGGLADIYSAYPFGVITFSLFIAMATVSLLIENVFTNRSFLSFLAEITIGSSVFWLCLWLTTYLASLAWQPGFTFEFWLTSKHLLVQIIISGLGGITVYYFSGLLLKLAGKKFLITQTNPKI